MVKHSRYKNIKKGCIFMAKMDERLEKMVERYREINDLMMQSDVVSDRKTMA